MTRYFVRNTITFEEVEANSLNDARILVNVLEEETRYMWAVVRKNDETFASGFNGMTDANSIIEWAIAQAQEIISAIDENRPCVIYGKPMTKEEKKEWADKFFED